MIKENLELCLLLEITHRRVIGTFVLCNIIMLPIQFGNDKILDFPKYHLKI